ncbi:MAG: LysM peptidoglycan-binding domain-containing protein [Cyanobacteria bacterium J069]|nr:MAG: LysM peptidoglycan-binding domain-containing protein [Cyanobacteria bacterium J069]
MLGLALSMGASSLLLPRHSDQATAAEPSSVESKVSTGLSTHEPNAQVSPTEEAAGVESKFSPSTGSARLSSGQAYSGPMFTHRVRSGQSLYRIARYYRVPVRTLAEVNGLSLKSVLRVGQAIQVPGTRRLEQIRSATSTVQRSEVPQVSRHEPVPSSPGRPSSESVDLSSVPSVPAEAADLSEEIAVSSRPHRYVSLENLRQRRERLRELLNAQQPEIAPDSPVAFKEQNHAATAAGSEVSEDKQLVSPALPSAPESGREAQLPVTAVLPVADSPATVSAVYRVKPGDTLGAIALAHEVPQSVLAATNGLTNPDRLQISQVLSIPARFSALNPAASTLSQPSGAVSLEASEAGQPTLLAHRVSAGETVEQIASAYGVSKDAVVEASGLENPNVIRVGQVIAVPSEPTELVSSASRQSSVVLPPAESRSAETESTAFEPSSAVPTISTGNSVLFATEFVGVGGVAPTRTEPVSTSATEVATAILTQTQGRTYDHLRRLLSDVAPLQASDSMQSAASTKFDSDNRPAVVAALTLSGVGSTSPVFGDRSEPAVPGVAPELTEQPQVASEASELTVAADAELAVAADAELADVGLAERPELVAVASPTQEPSPASRDEQLVAAAPLGSEGYEPLLEPLVGRMVSPDLPALSQMEAFLPEGSSVSNGYIWPARGVLTSGFGWRWGRMHRGIDIAAPVGTPIVAAADGVVEFSGWNSGGYGYMIDIRHSDGSRTRYAHNSRLLVRVGEQVDQGQHIAAMGSTGYSTGPHVHFEIHVPSQGTVNPISLLARR